MPLTVVVGSSGSGKTTLINDVHELNKCVYIRQYHQLRPYTAVCKIPVFDPSKLPFWNLYSDKKIGMAGNNNQSYNPNVKVGGTMAGEFTPGLSGGQRKMMLFELVCQRLAGASGLLICLDEPFAGVTENFVPFITERLRTMSGTHNVLLVTNDHVATLKEMATSIITVSSVDRTHIFVNDVAYSRDVALRAVATGRQYGHIASKSDLLFFLDTEVLHNPGLGGVLGFTVFAMGLFLLSFWDSQPGSEALVIVAIQMVCFFALQPYLVVLADWRNTVMEEAEALMHCSIATYKFFKSCLVMLLLTFISGVAFGILNACIDTLDGVDIWISMLFDSASLTLPFICFGLYSRLPMQVVQIVSSLPFLLMMLFSTTFSPGSGVEGAKVLRFLFARFYFWCKLPVVKNTMDGCPGDDELDGYIVFTGSLAFILFVAFQAIRASLFGKQDGSSVQDKRRGQITSTEEFAQLSKALFN